MAEYLSPAHRKQRWATIGKVGSWLTGIGASIYVSLTVFGTAGTMSESEMQLTAGESEVDISEMAGNAAEYVAEQTQNATLVSGLVGVLALLGVGGAAYWLHRREEAREHRERLDVIQAEWQAEQAAKEEWAAYYVDRAMELEATRPKMVDEMNDSELLDMVRKRAPEPMGDGLYKARMYGHPILGEGDAATPMVEANGPVVMDYVDANGNYYFQDFPTTQYAQVA